MATRYKEIGSFDAKTKLSELLRNVERGQRYTITLRGRPIADWVPSRTAKRRDAREAVEAMKRIKKVRGLSAKAVAEWIAEGRH